MEKEIFKAIEKELAKISNLDEKTKANIYANFAKFKKLKMNLMIVGGTGCGKSSTINALFEKKVAKVGDTPNSETMTIDKYELGNLILWDSPGLGDGKEADQKHSKAIIDKLMEKGNDGNGLIDLVLVVIDASVRDMGTDYQLINEVTIPVLKDKKRILVALNKCDLAMSRKRGKPDPWNAQEEKPTPELLRFLDEKVNSVKKRIQEATKVNIEPIYYSAEWYYNISKLLYFIIEHAPEDKRVVVTNKMNRKPEVWRKDDEVENYQKEMTETVKKSVGRTLTAGAGAATGAAIGSVIPVIGTAIGAVIGGLLGWFFG